jgi:hypothetical protein
METLRLPLSVSKASLRSALDTFSCLACLLTPAAKSSLVCQVVVCASVLPCSGHSEKETGGSLKFPREPFRTFALLLDPGRTIALGVLALWYCSRRHKDEGSSYLSIFRGSIARLLYSLHTLEAAISDDSPMLASGRLPPFPGGLCGPTGFLQRISTSGYPIVSFLSGFILTLYAGFKLELAGAER